MKLRIGIVLCFLGFLFASGCNSSLVEEAYSPCLMDFTVHSMNQGSEDTQYVMMELLFDKPVAVQKKALDSLRILIAGERINSEDCLLEKMEDKVLVLTIKVTAITNGQLLLTSADQKKGMDGITSVDGHYRCMPFEIQCLIPSGVALRIVESVPGSANDNPKIVKEVIDYCHIRSIAWVKLLENGKTVLSKQQNALDMLEGLLLVVRRMKKNIG